METQVFLGIVLNLSQAPQRMPKLIVMGQIIAPPPLAVNAEIDKNVNNVLQDGANGTVTAVYYKTTEFRVVQMK